MSELLQIKPVGTPDLPKQIGIAENGWLPGGMGNKEFILKTDDMLRLVGRLTGIRKVSETRFYIWYRPDPEAVKEIPIEQFRRNLMRPPRGNEEGGYVAYDDWEV